MVSKNSKIADVGLQIGLRFNKKPDPYLRPGFILPVYQTIIK